MLKQFASVCLDTIYFCTHNDVQLSVEERTIILNNYTAFYFIEEQILLSDNAACLAVQVTIIIF